MSKTGGGRGTNQHAIKGRANIQAPEPERSEVLLGIPLSAGDEAPFDPINQPYGATPVAEDAREELLAHHQGIETMKQLNSLEAVNIANGLLWARTEGLETEDFLNQGVLRDVHRHMFGEVWQWAGRIRQRELTIGIDPVRIQEEWQHALGDAAYWIEHRTFGPVEVVLRLHHRTVQIHPFVNGNGRHARLMSEELALALELPDGSITWGSHLGLPPGEGRKRYLSALRRLDMNRNDVQELLELATDPSTPPEWP